MIVAPDEELEDELEEELLELEDELLELEEELDEELLELEEELPELEDETSQLPRPCHGPQSLAAGASCVHCLALKPLPK